MPQYLLHNAVNHTAPRVLIIGTDAHVLTEGSGHRARMLRYADVLGELHIIVLGAHGHPKGPIELGEHVYAYPTTSSSRVGALVEGLRIGREIMRKHTIDIVSTQDPFETALIGELARRGTEARLNIMSHGDFFSESYWRRERLLHQVRYLVGLWLIRRADCFRVVSERIKRDLMRRGVLESRISVVPLSTDVARFAGAVPNPAVQALRPEGGILIGTMARLTREKNIPLLIRACNRVRATGVNARLVIAGKGPELARLRACATESAVADAVTFLDWVDDPAGFQKALDVYALSSDHEGWGLVCIEALAAGTPLLMTDVGCAGEVVRDGENGLVVPVRDEQAFGDALLRLATDATLRATLAEAGRESVRHLASKEDHLERYRKSLECCIVHPHENTHTDEPADRRTS